MPNIRQQCEVTAQQLRDLLDYDGSSGVFRWRSACGRARAGDVAGIAAAHGSRQISIGGRKYVARRLAWLYVYGTWPQGTLAPANGDPGDDRIANIVERTRVDPEAELSVEQLRAALAYDPASGVFRWRLASGAPGEVAGSTDDDGRVRIGFNGRLHFAHRLAFLYVNGAWPGPCVDHEDGNPGNNQWTNLRDVSHTLNSQNQRRAHRGATSRYLGVYWRKDRRKWQATIVVDRQPRHLGLFAVEEEAAQAYLAAKRQLHAGCTV